MQEFRTEKSFNNRIICNLHIVWDLVYATTDIKGQNIHKNTNRIGISPRKFFQTGSYMMDGVSGTFWG